MPAVHFPRLLFVRFIIKMETRKSVFKGCAKSDLVVRQDLSYSLTTLVSRYYERNCFIYLVIAKYFCADLLDTPKEEC